MQHTMAPLAAALSPFMSLLYPPNAWWEWCDVWRLTTPPGSVSPCLFKQWCGFFYIPQKPDKYIKVLWDGTYSFSFHQLKTPSHLHFLSFLTQRLSFCSKNVVKVWVSSILKKKKFTTAWAGFDPGTKGLQSITQTTRPSRIYTYMKLRKKMLSKF